MAAVQPARPRARLPVLQPDSSYRRLLGDAAWQRLHAAVRRRFSIRPASGAPVVYDGVMTIVENSRAGWLFAQACRLLGRALVTRAGRRVPVRVCLTWDETLQGVAWQRDYAFDGGRDLQTVRSVKVTERDGIVEYVGRGFAMRMRVTESGGNLVFTSTRYELRLGKRRFVIPGWLTPGITTVTHEHLGADRFRFTLAVDHPWLGTTFRQCGIFRDAQG